MLNDGRETAGERREESAEREKTECVQRGQYTELSMPYLSAFPVVRHPTRLDSTALYALLRSAGCLLACLLLACCSGQPIAVLCCALLCCSLRRTDALLRVVPARCTAEPTTIRCGCKSMQLQMQMQMQMHGRATARLALVPTDQLDAAKANQRPANAQRLRAWHSGESVWPLLTASR